MTTRKTFRCMVDDTALITNISELETWVLRGIVTLVIPLYTLERLHLLKKDTSQIGTNARKAVKFLDQATSNADLAEPVVIQGPDDQYATWAEVEKHYAETSTDTDEDEDQDTQGEHKAPIFPPQENEVVRPGHVTEGLSQLVKDKLGVRERDGTSPLSTPPLSPTSSGPQSSKTSPEIKSASMIVSDKSPVPPGLKALVNPIVWYTHEHQISTPGHILMFLTNSSDNTYLARDFGVQARNIHQLRAAIGMEEQEAKNHDKYQKKHSQGTPKPSSEPKTLFRYEEDESEEEEVVFKPRGRGTPRATATARGGNPAGRGKHAHSPANSLSSAVVPTPVKPQIPTEEIDPDSFDRGNFARGNTPLVSVGNHSPQPHHGTHRSHTPRGNASHGGPSRGGSHRGNHRGSHDRGNARGRGRLFVP